MSLKAFHIFFVSLASALAFGFAGWALPSPPAGAGADYKIMGLLSLALGVGLIVYGFWFWRKIKHLAQ